jgi:hypothetical protein
VYSLFQMSSDDWLAVLSIGFLFLVPYAIGVLTLALSPAHQRTRWAYAIFAPWVPCIVIGVVVGLIQAELWICVLMALPLFMLMAMLGGLTVKFVADRRARRGSGSDQGRPPGAMLGVLVLLPFVATPISMQVGGAMTTRTVERSILVHATPEQVWSQIVAVPEIQPEEHRFAWFTAVGLPRPVEATVTADGAGAMRSASYANGIRVLEPVDEWQPHSRYGFSVELDMATPLPSAIWQAVEGNHFDVTHVAYTLESTPDGTLLRLATNYRLETPVNGYAAAWMDFLLGDFESYILEIVKRRAEAL